MIIIRSRNAQCHNSTLWKINGVILNELITHLLLRNMPCYTPSLWHNKCIYRDGSLVQILFATLLWFIPRNVGIISLLPKYISKNRCRKILKYAHFSWFSSPHTFLRFIIAEFARIFQHEQIGVAWNFLSQFAQTF